MGLGAICLPMTPSGGVCGGSGVVCSSLGDFEGALRGVRGSGGV